MIPDERRLPGLYMVWPGHRLSPPLETETPAAYSVRVYAKGDEAGINELFSAEDWEMNEDQWSGYKDRLLPNGLFLILNRESDRVVATAGALHNPRPGRFFFPFGGELGNLFVHPQHRGMGLGAIATACAVNRLLAAGYDSIRVGVQGWRLPALKTYLKVGFVPFLHDENLMPRWERICGQIEWPYTPGEWPKTLAENQDSNR